MQGAGATTRFKAASTRRLRRRGVDGEVSVDLVGESLRIAGERGGALLVTPARVRRLRAGWEDGEFGASHATRLWLEGDGRGDGKPLVLQPKDRAAQADYAAVIRGFAAAIARAGGLARLERGTSAAGALFLPLVFGPLCLVAIGLSLTLLEGEPWWGRLLVPAIPLAAFLYGLHALRRTWPRPAADLADFDRHVAR